MSDDDEYEACCGRLDVRRACGDESGGNAADDDEASGGSGEEVDADEELATGETEDAQLLEAPQTGRRDGSLSGIASILTVWALEVR